MRARAARTRARARAKQSTSSPPQLLQLYSSTFRATTKNLVPDCSQSQTAVPDIDVTHNTLMSERPVLVTFVDSDVFAAKVCSLSP